MLMLLPTCTGVIVPQTFVINPGTALPPQTSDQSTPNPVGSLLTDTVTSTDKLTTTEVTCAELVPFGAVTEIAPRLGLATEHPVAMIAMKIEKKSSRTDCRPMQFGLLRRTQIQDSRAVLKIANRCGLSLDLFASRELRPIEAGFRLSVGVIIFVGDFLQTVCNLAIALF
jgi:hypothetical protein